MDDLVNQLRLRASFIRKGVDDYARPYDSALDTEAADRIEALESKSGQAYQVIGVLWGRDRAGEKTSVEEWVRILDYFAGDAYDENFLPWPRNDA